MSREGLIQSDGTDGLNNYYALAQTSQKKSTHYTIKPSTQEKQFFRLNILNTASNEDLSRVEKGLKMITSLFPMNSSLCRYSLSVK